MELEKKMTTKSRLTGRRTHDESVAHARAPTVREGSGWEAGAARPGTWGTLFQSRLCPPSINSSRDQMCGCMCCVTKESACAAQHSQRLSATDVIAADGCQVGNGLKHSFSGLSLDGGVHPEAIHLVARSGFDRTKTREVD